MGIFTIPRQKTGKMLDVFALQRKKLKQIAN